MTYIFDINIFSPHNLNSTFSQSSNILNFTVLSDVLLFVIILVQNDDTSGWIIKERSMFLTTWGCLLLSQPPERNGSLCFWSFLCFSVSWGGGGGGGLLFWGKQAMKQRAGGNR